MTGYHVYRDGQTPPIATVPSGTTYTDTALTNESQHDDTVSAFDWRHLGIGPHSFKIGRRVFYRAGDVYAWLRAQHDKHGPTAA